MNKRGEGEQFNWIFVIVSGAIILGFFIMFTFKYMQLEQNKMDIETVTLFGIGVLSTSSNLQTGSGGAAVDSDSRDGLRFGSSVLFKNRCTSNDSMIMINKGDFAWYKLDDEIVFMDSEMKVKAFDIWVLPWNFPFHISNFIYLADPETTFYIVGNTPLGFDISSVFDIEAVSSGSFKVKDNSKVIYFGEQKPAVSDIKRIKGNFNDVDFVYINNGKASFFDHKKNQWSDEVNFYTTENNLEQLYGAVFSNDAINFKCNINRALNRLRTVSIIYSEKAKVLNQIDRRPDCHYINLGNSLKEFSEAEDMSNLIDDLSRKNLEASNCAGVF